MNKSTPNIYYWKVSLRKFLFVVASIAYSLSYGQNIEVEWEKTFSGSSDERDANIIQTKDKGFLLMYNRSSVDDTIEKNRQDKNILVFKLNAFGEIQWKRSLGGSQNDYFKSVIETNQGYLIVGQSASDDGDLSKNEGESDAWIVQLDLKGGILWQTMYGKENHDCAHIVIEDDDGFNIIGRTAKYNKETGPVKGEVWMLKISSDGIIQSYKTISESKGLYPKSIAEFNKNQYIILGHYLSNKNGDTYSLDGDYYVAVLDIDGTIHWEKTYGGSGSESPSQMIKTSYNEYLIIGSSTSKDGDVSHNYCEMEAPFTQPDSWLIKIDTLGNLLWEKSYGGFYSDDGNSIFETNEEEFIVFGSKSQDNKDSVNLGSLNYWIFKIDEGGRLLWEEFLNHKNFAHNEVLSVTETFDGGFIVIGLSTVNRNYGSGDRVGSELWLVKLKTKVNE